MADLVTTTTPALMKESRTEQPAAVPWVTGVDRYATILGEIFDVGIAPLRVDRFTTCRS